MIQPKDNWLAEWLYDDRWLSLRHVSIVEGEARGRASRLPYIPPIPYCELAGMTYELWSGISWQQK